jgi:hypothetical protein
MRWVVTTHMGDRRNIDSILVVKPQKVRPLGTAPTHKLENVKINHRKIV